MSFASIHTSAAFVAFVALLSTACLSTPGAPAFDGGGDPGDGMIEMIDAGDGGNFDDDRLCVVGAAIAETEHACAAEVCARAPTCCATQWGPECVDLAELECSRHCSTGVATASHAAMAMGVRTGPGQWAQVASVTYPVWVQETSWADYDGDGDADVVMGRHCGARIYRNNGYVDSLLQLEQVYDGDVDSTNGCWRLNMEWGDADDDGDLDLAVAGIFGLVIIENRGEGASPRFEAQAPLVDTASVLGLGWADYNGDGDADLFGMVYNQGLRLFRNTEGVLAEEPNWTTATSGDQLVACHIDGSPAAPSIVAVDYSVALLRNQGQSIATTPAWTVNAPAGFYTEVACGDLDGDGVAEIVAVARDEVTEMNNTGIGHVRVLSPSNGDVLWTSPTQYYGGHVDVGDVNGDGRLDIVVADDPPGADSMIPEPFHVYLTDPGSPLSLTEEAGADFVAASDTTRIEIVDLSERK